MTKLTCAECRQPILDIKDGMVEWIDSPSGISDVRIVHNPSESPLMPKKNCYKHTHHYHRCDLHLHQVIADRELVDRLGLSGLI